jgi:hypothetical protein
MRRFVRISLAVGSSLALFAGCADPASEPLNEHETASDSPTTPSRYLYVASGSCYGGGVTTSTGTGTVSRFDLKTGAWLSLVQDYNTSSPGDQPVGIANYDRDRLLVTIENTSGRRVDLISKVGGAFSTYLTNSTALNAVLRAVLLLPDKSVLISKSSAIEKFSSGKSRVLVGANPYVSAPASSCATSTTLISSMISLSDGKIVFAHAAATPNNKIALISASGYSTTADCLAAVSAPTTTALPSAILLHSSGKLLVAYGSTTAGSNFVYAYDVDRSTNTINGATLAFSDIGVVNGPSAMVEDPATSDVLIANATSTFNTIERFSFNPGTKLLTRSSSIFAGASAFSRCVTSMVVAE